MVRHPIRATGLELREGRGRANQDLWGKVSFLHAPPRQKGTFYKKNHLGQLTWTTPVARGSTEGLLFGNYRAVGKEDKQPKVLHATVTVWVSSLFGFPQTPGSPRLGGAPPRRLD